MTEKNPINKTNEIEGVTYEYTKKGKVKKATVELDFDFEVNGIHYTELTFGVLKVKHTYAAENEDDGLKSGYLMYAQMANVPIEVIDEVAQDDLELITEAILPLMGKSAGEIAKAELEKAKKEAMNINQV